MIMEAIRWMVVLYALAAMIMDLKGNRISNRFLLTGWAAGALLSCSQIWQNTIWQYLTGAALPVVLLFVLFYYRMLGAGDIKLLSVLGGVMGIRASLYLVVWSFLIGGLLATGVLTVRRIWAKRFRFFIRYVQNYRTAGIRIPYRPRIQGKENLHFAISVFAAVLLWKGGVF